MTVTDNTGKAIEEPVLIEILNFIENIDEDLSRWHGGIAFDPVKRENEYKMYTAVRNFKSWKTNNRETAKQIENILHQKGVKNEFPEMAAICAIEGLRMDAVYIYVFQKD